MTTHSESIDMVPVKESILKTIDKSSIYSILRKRFPEKEYALMEEVRDKAGFDATRSSDYLAVNLWPSRGFAVHGIELKRFRNDWLTELKKPEKSANIFQYCNHFWLLTTTDNIAKIDEIPDSWGWLTIKGGRIKLMKNAPQLTPNPIPITFMCAMLKRAVDKSNYVHVDDIKDDISTSIRQSMITKEREL